LTIRVRIGEEEIGTTTADQERDDLRDGKVGDGKHAFVFRLPSGRESELERLEILATTEDGVTVRLTTPAVGENPVANAAGSVHDLLGRLVHSHRVLHRNLQSGLAGIRDGAAPSNLEELRSVQEKMTEQLRSIEVAVVRLDGVAQALSVAATGAKPRSTEPATITLLVLVAIAAGGSFACELLRYAL
jgi:hypothetical protein